MFRRTLLAGISERRCGIAARRLRQRELEIAGDSAVNLVVSREISPQASEDVTCLAAAIRKLALSGITDVVPTYCSVMVCYNPLVM